jgi:hypothetical protein
MVGGARPDLEATEFICPHCERLTQHEWLDLWSRRGDQLVADTGFAASRFGGCGSHAIWGAELIYPPMPLRPFVEEDLPPEIRTDVHEARLILAVSPRASAALLRLALQKLCAQLGCPGESLEGDIANLVTRKGLPTSLLPLFQAACLRESQVAAGLIESSATRRAEEAAALLELIGLIVQGAISAPRRGQSALAAFTTLPHRKPDAAN